jgi:hypothetical protein
MPPTPKAETKSSGQPEDYRNLDLHVVSLGDGRMVGIGEIFQLTPEQATDEHNMTLLNEGIIVNLQDYEDSISGTEVQQAEAEPSTKKEGAKE